MFNFLESKNLVLAVPYGSTQHTAKPPTHWQLQLMFGPHLPTHHGAFTFQSGLARAFRLWLLSSSFNRHFIQVDGDFKFQVLW
jgi:hypothetical protein